MVPGLGVYVIMYIYVVDHFLQSVHTMYVRDEIDLFSLLVLF